MANTKDVGIFTELKVLTKLVSMGFIVSQPYGDNAPYDFIVDIGIKLIKIQVKTAQDKKDGSITIPLCKREGHQRKKRKSYHYLNVDAVISYSRKYDEYYYIDVEKRTTSDITLRPFSKIKRKIKTINIAEDFILDKHLNPV